MKYLLLIFIMVAAIMAAGCFAPSSSSQSSSSYPSQPVREITISDITTSWDYTWSQPTLIIQGLVTNNLGRSEGYVLVTCNIYDLNGVKMGYSNDGLGELANGASARFKVEIMGGSVNGAFNNEFKYICQAT
jgi:hypothetical protein